jgi:AcrR family transcriptional regulator
MPRFKDAEAERIKQETRAKLLAAAEVEFAAQGYRGANINRIAQAAGFAQGTIYNYFPSKRVLFELIVQDIAARHSTLILQSTATASDPNSRLERFLATGFAFAQGFQTAAQIVISALYGPDAEARDLVQHAYAPLLSYLEHDIVQTGLQEGAFRPADAQVATALLLAVYLGGCAPGPSGEQLRLHARVAGKILLEGLASKA